MTKGANANTNKPVAQKNTTAASASNTKVETHVQSRSAGSPSRAHNLGLFEQLSIFWLTLLFALSAVFDGVWYFHHKEIATAAPLPDSFSSFHSLFQSAWKRENALSAVVDTAISLIKSVWKSNAITDKRFATNDLFLQSYTGLNFYFLAPLFLLLAYGIAHRRSWRLSLQLVVTTVKLTGFSLYVLTEYLNNGANINTKGDQHIAFYAGNIALIIPTFFLFLQAFFNRTNTGLPYPKSHRISFTVKFLVGALVLSIIALAATSIGHHYYDSKEVRELLKSALDYTQVYANSAYTTASAAAAEGLHQAHILAAPYIDQAAEFVHDNLGGKA